MYVHWTVLRKSPPPKKTKTISQHHMSLKVNNPQPNMNVTQSYKDLQRTEDQEELLSTTDVDRSSDDEEKPWSSAGLRGARWSTDRGFISILKDYWWLITTCLLSITIILQLIIWNEISSRSFHKAPQVGGDYLGKGPTCS